MQAALELDFVENGVELFTKSLVITISCLQRSAPDYKLGHLVFIAAVSKKEIEASLTKTRSAVHHF